MNKIMLDSGLLICNNVKTEDITSIKAKVTCRLVTIVYQSRKGHDEVYLKWGTQ